jgi:hypothetical protein
MYRALSKRSLVPHCGSEARVFSQAAARPLPQPELRLAMLALTRLQQL